MYNIFAGEMGPIRICDAGCGALVYFAKSLDIILKESEDISFQAEIDAIDVGAVNKEVLDLTNNIRIETHAMDVVNYGILDGRQ